MRALLFVLLMASTTLAAAPVIEFVAPPGFTLDVLTFGLGSDIVAETIEDVTQETNRVGVYLATTDGVTETYSGVYHVVVLVANTTDAIAVGYVDMADDSAKHRVMADLGSLASAQNTENDTALADYDGPTNAEMEARTIVAASYFDPAVDEVALVTAVTTVNGLANDSITAAVLAENAIGSSEIATAAIGFEEFNSGAITANAIADNAIDSGALAASAITEIVTGVWNALTADYGTAGTYGEHIEALTTGGATASAIWDYDISGVSTAGYAGDYLNNVAVGTVTVVGPVVDSDGIELDWGDSYKDAHGRRLEWTSDDWTDLTTATISFAVWKQKDKSRLVDDIAGVVVTPGVGSQTIGVEIDDADWETYDPVDPTWQFKVTATIGGEPITLSTGSAVIRWDGSE